MTIDPATSKRIAYGLSGVAIVLIVVGIYVPTARDYLVAAAKMLLTVVTTSVQ